MRKMAEYNHKKIESKWQKEWEKSGIYHAKNNSKKPKYYSLIEFPYPSGAGMHVGHIRSNTAMDIISRKRRMEGYNVLYPIGWDAFGLPTENYAIKTGIHPIKVTKDNTDTFRRQLKSIGFSFDWSREINTTDPKYYKWTQWIFLQFFKKGLAYKTRTEINWCLSCKIGLANEEVVGGMCERCGGPTEKREKEQWMLAITKYADRLDKDLDGVDYLSQIKLGQRNWIGKSEGAEIEFKIIHPSPTLPEGKGEIPGYYTTDIKSFRLLQEKAVAMRENPTEAEKKLWQKLKGDKNNFHFRQQHIINKFIVDFVCLSKNLVIEIDGDIHDYQKDKDKERTEILQTFGFKIIRVKNEEVLNDISSVIRKISNTLEALPFGEGLGGVDLNATYPPTPSPREGEEYSIKVFTTRPDTIFGATYIVLAPEHELITNLKLQITNWGEVEKYIKETKNKTEINRTEEKIKTGIELKGIKAINPATKEEIPIWIADYVLATYGTGAIMAVSAHDERDFEFAEKFKLPIIKNYKKAGFEDFGKMITKFKLRDWIFSRQRYWGEPIPVIHCEACGMVGVPEKDLPVELPKVKNYQPTDSGESPLANISKWVNVKCPKCKGKAKRETDTMPNWAGSSWYYLRYTDPKNKKEFASKKNLKYWLTTPSKPPPKEEAPNSSLSFGEGQGGVGGGLEGVGGTGGVNWYNGGNEHTTLHLLYSRFWHKFLFDLKLVPTSEPYMKRTSHGMILGEGGVKMSKSLGNVINPDDIVKTYGADTLRIYEMFMGPFNQSVAWSTESIIGARRFIEKVWRVGQKVRQSCQSVSLTYMSKRHFDNFVTKLLHKTIEKVSEDIEEMHFNTAISSMMILATEMEKAESVPFEDYKKFLKILSPFAPHVAEELWGMLGEKKSINLSDWPKADKNLLQDEEVKIAVQINGKVRAEIMIKTDSEEEKIKEQAASNETILRHLAGKDIKRVIYVKNRLINIVV